MKKLSVTINGENIIAEVEPRTSLADFLRNSRGLTGTHIGCEHGVCGACTVTIDGSPARSCIAYAVQMEGRNIRTIEGYDDDEVMLALRAQFSQQHGLQCGFCTPGMLITSRDIVRRLGDPGEDRVREELAGNLCRCTGYAGIVRAVQNVGVTQGLAPSEVRKSKPTGTAFPPALLLSERDLASKPERTILPPVALAGVTTIEYAVLIDASRDHVWTFFHDLPAVARCLPGAELSKHDAETWAGIVRIKMGPVLATVTGHGRYRLVEAEKAGRLEGSGIDKLSRSKVSGALTFSLVDSGHNATRLTLSLSYTLQGPLAQFARSSLAKEFVRLVVEDFGRNVGAELSGVSHKQSEGFSLGRLLKMIIASLWRKGS